MNLQTCFLLIVLCICPDRFSGHGLLAQEPNPPNPSLPQIGGIKVTVILERLGAQMETGASSQQLADYAWHFQRLDQDQDGQHSPKEYIENGHYMTPQARQVIFRAAVGDGNGLVTEAEYVLNRVITDEAKAIMQPMDRDRDGNIEPSEFIDGGSLPSATAVLVFEAFDQNQDRRLSVPEYLRVWGQWARAGRPPAAKRISQRISAISEDPLLRWLKNFDTNQNGMLEEREWQDWLRRADQNGDGKLNRSELKPPAPNRPDRTPDGKADTEKG